MKFKIIRIDENKDEEFIAYLHQNSENEIKIAELLGELKPKLVAYDYKSAYTLSLDEIYAFSTENGKTHAILSERTLDLKERLYVLERIAGDSFLKINQSCLVNVSKILKFEASFSGAMLVVMKNGFKDYVSRRQIRNVKERMGIRK